MKKKAVMFIGISVSTILILCVFSSPILAQNAWFGSLDLEMIVPDTDVYGVPTGEESAEEGANAAAVFDADLDGYLDISLIAGDYYFVFLNKTLDPDHVKFQENRYYIGDPEDSKRYRPACYGLADFNRDGAMDLYLSNRGKGTVVTFNTDPPSNRGLTYNPKFSTLINQGDGTFQYEDIGLDGDGNKKTAIFEDFDGDGNFDSYLSVSPYYGPAWPQSEAGNQLYTGGDDWRVNGPNVIEDIITNRTDPFWYNEDGKGIIDFKGAVIRDFDKDGKPDIITGAYSDIWNPPGFPRWPITTPDMEGFQGDWNRGIFVFRNVSTVGSINFEDVSHEAIENAYGTTDQMHVYSALPSDIDNDGDLDLIVSGVRNFTAHNSEKYMVDIIRVYRNDSEPGNIKFTDITVESGMDFMNYNDQLPGWYEGGFTRTVYGNTITLVPQMHAAAAIDIDNDGDRDFIAVDRQLLDFDPENGQPLDLNFWVFLNDGNGRFTYIDPSVHGLSGLFIDLSYGDINNNGRIDIVGAGGGRGGIFRYPPKNTVFINNIENNNNYIKIETKLNEKNIVGIGTKVWIYKSGTLELLGYDEIRTDFSYGSKKSPILHFGLGDIEQVDVKLEAPNGKTSIHNDLEGNESYLLSVENDSGDGGCFITTIQLK